MAQYQILIYENESGYENPDPAGWQRAMDARCARHRSAASRCAR